MLLNTLAIDKVIAALRSALNAWHLWLLQAAAAAAVVGSSAACTAAEMLPQDQQMGAAKPLRSSCPAPPEGRPAPARPSRHMRRHSTGQGPGSASRGTSGAALAAAGAVASPTSPDDDEEVAATRHASAHHKHVKFVEASNQLRQSKQAGSTPQSPAVAAAAGQAATAAKCQANGRQGRAFSNSPQVGSAGARQHRRASLGGGGVLPLAGYSFLLTGYADDKQKKSVLQKITHLGGHVLDDLPKPVVTLWLSACAASPVL